MTRKTTLALSATFVGALGLGGAALAHGFDDDGYGARGGGMKGMHGMMSRMMGGGMMGGGPGMRMIEQADVDGDGRVTAEEAASFRSEQISTHDADGDGSLSLEEFAALHAANTRPMMVDRFQSFDEDGDGTVTEAEMAAPFSRMLRMMDSDGDGAIGPEDMRHRRAGMRPGRDGGMGAGMDRDDDD